MKQNSSKIIKNRLKTIKQKNTFFSFLLKKSFFFNKHINLERNWLIKTFKLNFLNQKVKKICNKTGKFKSINRKLKLSRTSVNCFLIENLLNFYKKMNINFKYTFFFFKKLFVFII